MIINQIIPSNWNYNLIDQRFDIFKLTCCGSFNQNILDIQDDKVRFVSTVYLTGWTAFSPRRTSTRLLRKASCF